MTSKAHPVDTDAIFARIAATSGSDIFEPRESYQVSSRLPGIAHFATDQSTKLPLERLSISGSDNYIFTGTDALLDRLGHISIQGNGNAIYLGVDCRFPSLKISIVGDGNVIYLGPFANGGELQVDVNGEGRTIRLGQDAMLARTRLVIGMGSEIVATDAAGARLSPASGRPLTDNSDIILDGAVWVGREGLITEGVYIGPSAVVGARSFVMTDLMGASVNTGAPARRITQGVTFSRSKAKSLEADRALSRHGHRERRLGALRARMEDVESSEHELLLSDRLVASPIMVQPEVKLDPPNVRRKAPVFKGDYPREALADAYMRLTARAAGRPIELTLPADPIVATGDGLIQYFGEKGGYIPFSCRGRNNYLFAASPGDLNGLELDLSEVENALIYIGPGVKVSGQNIIQVKETADPFIYIGANSSLGGVDVQVSGPDAQLVIGSDCLLSPAVTLQTSEGYSAFDPQTGDSLNPKCSIVIGDHVYVGYDVLIGKGANIGQGSILAPRSVVNGELPSNGFHSGFPARRQIADIQWTRRLM